MEFNIKLQKLGFQDLRINLIGSIGYITFFSKLEAYFIV